MTFYVGGATGGNGDPKTLETKAGVPFGIRRTYHGSDVASVVKTVQANIAAHRAVSEVSMKPDFSWKDMASGKGDAWAKNVASELAKAVSGTRHVIKVTLNHEPENDTGTNAGTTAAGRDNWRGMHQKLAPMFAKPGVRYGVILMGYPQFFAPGKTLWNLDACVPKTKDVHWVGFDIYEHYAVQGKYKWTPFEDVYFKPIHAWCQANGKHWTISETGVSAEAFKAKPTWFSDMEALIKKYGGMGLSYFNTNLNSVAGWEMESGGPREKAFLDLVRKNKI